MYLLGWEKFEDLKTIKQMAIKIQEIKEKCGKILVSETAPVEFMIPWFEGRHGRKKSKKTPS